MSTSTAGILQPAFDRLAELARLEVDWDSYGALPPSPEALDAARSFLITVVEQFGDAAAERVVPYSLMPIVDGGIQLEWRGATGAVELNIGPTRAMSFLLIERHGEQETFSEGSNLRWPGAIELVRWILLA